MDSGLTLALSFLIGGIFLMTVLNTQVNLQKTATVNYLEENVHQNMDGMREILKTDIEKVGYNIDLTEVSSPIILSKLHGSSHFNSIKFYLDVKSEHEDDTDNDLDSIHIWVSDTTALANTENGSDCYLYRRVNNGDSLMIGSGVTFFEVEKQNMSDLVNGDDVVIISLVAETPYSYEEQFFSAMWKGRICPKNLR
ncbi:MAG: hypothetical protein K9M80_01190 [Candidatus Marinimicrobia bacterium]|nr:hypothetical protein [Candidatus Neomarinimicrobiota bacterium]